MDILKLNFFIYNYCGLWWPDQAPASFKKKLYTILTFITLTMMYFFTLMQFLDLVFQNYNIEEMTDNSFMVLTMISVCFKATTFVLRRESIIHLLNTLRKDICKSKNETERRIQKKYDTVARSNTLLFAFFGVIACSGFLMVPILTEGYKRRILPFKAWLPYSLSNPTLYWVTYVQESVSLLVAAHLNVAGDTLVSGFLVQACAQLDILGDRIMNLVNPHIARDEFGKPVRISDAICADVESTVIKCVEHHVMICKFATKVQSVFGWVMFFQFFVSMVSLCSSVLKLSRKGAATTEIAAIVAYIGCLLLQLLFYCWHGNEVKLKSLSLSDAVFIAEWPMLHPNTIKSLKMIMMRSNIPIEITCGSMFTLSMATYAMVLKASYSAFNLLQTV